MNLYNESLKIHVTLRHTILSLLDVTKIQLIEARLRCGFS